MVLLPYNLITTGAALLVALPSATAAQSRATYTQWALQSNQLWNSNWYSNKTGLWNGTWWNSGCMLTTLANIAILDQNLVPNVTAQFATTYAKASGKYGRGWLDGFYDDEGWWATGWMKAYDVTGNTTYLQAAETIFADMIGGLNATCGGIWWDKPYAAKDGKQSNNAIAQTLYLATAASLANRVTNNAAYYANYALTQWDYLLNGGYIHKSDWHIHDFLNVSDNCVGASYTFSYDAGTFLQGALELAKYTKNNTYLQVAADIANGTIIGVSRNGILTEFTYPKLENYTISQFKGTFMRTLAELQRAVPSSEWLGFIQTNADSIWNNARSPMNGILSSLWQGPLQDLNVESFSSALDALTAAALVTS